MTRHGRRIQRSGRTGALALLVVLLACAAPARAFAWDAPLEPVSFAAAVPTSTASPVASGPLVRGSVVSVTTGAWTDAPTTYTYVWQRDMGAGYTTIPGAAAATYTLAGADVSANVRALVTARNATGPSAPSASNALGPVAGAPPVNSAAPSVSGTSARGSVLTAAPGTWAGVSNVYTYQWQRDDGTGFADITAAKTATYTLTTADEDALVRVLVRAVNVDGSVTLPSNEVGPIAATPPISSAVPAVTGTVKRGLTLTTNAGSWSGVGNTYAYQWQRNTGSGFADIAGATRNTYVLVTADTGALIRSKITATNPDGAASAYSLATGPVDAAAPVNTAAPTITGSARRTSVMTAAIGTWTGAGNTYAFQWQRDPGNGFADIPGATTANYTLTTADLGATVRIEVTATNADGSVVAVSAASDPVTASPPVQGAAPVVSGTPRTGQSLATTPGTWTPAGSTFTYQWQRDTGSGFADIAGATAATYALTSADAGAKVRSRVVASNADGATANFSSAVGPVIPTPVNTAAPTVTGTLTDASTLTVSPGTWDSAGVAVDGFKYQWVRCPTFVADAAATGCAVLPAATSPTYTTVAADVGSTLGVRVTATNLEGGTATAATAVTDVLIGRALTNSVRPAITGTAAVRSVQTAGDGAWSVPLTKATYQWRRCAANGSACVDILGAVGKTYTAAFEDTGKTLVVRVNAFSPGRTASEESYPTDPIAPLALPSVVADITIGGTAARMYSLRAIMPVWNEFPTVFSYQWLRCHADGNFCQPIAGATTAGYVLTKADEGSTIRVSQTASNTTGSATTTSLPTAVVVAVLPVATVLPVVSGTGVVGTTLSTTRGTWSTSPDTTYGYSWRRCDAAGNNCAVIEDAVASTYKVAAADVDSTLRAVVTAVNEDGTVAAVSGLSAKVRPAAPAVSPPPVLSGTATVGQTVTATTGTWTGISAIVKTTFWRCGSTCTAIVTSTARSYTLVAADAGLKIRASVTGVGPGGTTTTYAASVLGPVKSAAAASALAAGAPVALKSSTGRVLATTSASVPKAGGQATVTVKPAAGLKSGYRAWACPTAASGADWQPCTKPVKLGDRAARLRVAVDAGEKVRVVVARRGR